MNDTKNGEPSRYQIGDVNVIPCTSGDWVVTRRVRGVELKLTKDGAGGGYWCDHYSTDTSMRTEVEALRVLAATLLAGDKGDAAAAEFIGDEHEAEATLYAERDVALVGGGYVRIHPDGKHERIPPMEMRVFGKSRAESVSTRANCEARRQVVPASVRERARHNVTLAAAVKAFEQGLEWGKAMQAAAEALADHVKAMEPEALRVAMLRPAPPIVFRADPSVADIIHSVVIMNAVGTVIVEAKHAHMGRGCSLSAPCPPTHPNPIPHWLRLALVELEKATTVARTSPRSSPAPRAPHVTPDERLLMARAMFEHPDWRGNCYLTFDGLDADVLSHWLDAADAAIRGDLGWNRVSLDWWATLYRSSWDAVVARRAAAARASVSP